MIHYRWVTGMAAFPCQGSYPRHLSFIRRPDFAAVLAMCNNIMSFKQARFVRRIEANWPDLLRLSVQSACV